MRKGFTLIELLAVIVILAIIALIAVPIVMHIINDSKKSSEEESIKMYAKALEQAAAKYLLNHPNDKKITIKQLKEKKLIDYKGKEIICDIEKIYQNGKIYIKGCTVGGKIIDYEYGLESYKDYIHLLEDVREIGLSVGDKYAYKVNDTNTFNFYVLSIEEDKVNLIMDQNICNDGTLTSVNKQCKYAWYDDEDNDYRNDKINYGPATVMVELYEGTKNWTNVPTLEISYTDEGNKRAYSLSTNNGVATITGTGEAETTTIGTSSIPIKARLPKKSEVTEQGCTGTSGSCPTWLTGDYWLLSAQDNTSNRVNYIHSSGYISYQYSASKSFGARPVITVPISDL